MILDVFPKRNKPIFIYNNRFIISFAPYVNNAYMRTSMGVLVLQNSPPKGGENDQLPLLIWRGENFGFSFGND